MYIFFSLILGFILGYVICCLSYKTDENTELSKVLYEQCELEQELQILEITESNKQLKDKISKLKK